MTLIKLHVSVFLATVVLAECVRSDDFAVPTLVSGYSEAAGSIKTLYVKYVETFSGLDQEWSRSCVFARDGKKWHFSTRPIVGEGAAFEETVECSDGEQAFLYYRHRGPTGKIDLGTIQIIDRREEPMVTPEYAIGLKVPELSRNSAEKGSLSVLLNSGLPTTILPEASLGSGGLSIPLIPVKSGDVSAVYRISIRLDSDHGFLPAMYKVEFAEQTKKKYPSHRDWSLRWETTEFKKFPDGMSGSESWFPSEAKFTQVGGKLADGINPVSTYTHSIQSVTINEELSPSLFNPSRP